MTGKKRNPIIEADARDDSGIERYGAVGGEEAEAFDASEAAAQDSLTTEEVAEQMANLSESRRASIQRSRQRGRLPKKGHAGHKTTAARAQDVRSPRRGSEFDWRPANTLDAPPPQPNMEQRWIRISLGGTSDAKNVARKLREGWKPRTLDSVPDTFMPPTLNAGQLGEVIGVGDLILCERDVRIGQSRKKYFRSKLQRQQAAGRRHIEAVEHPENPISVHEPYEKPTVGVGRRRAKVQEDV